MSAESPEVQGRPKRPLGMTLLSLLLGWLTLSAVGNATFLIPAVGLPLYMTLLALAYAATAGAAAVGLWRMKRWGLTAFQAWGVVLLCLMVGILWGFPFVKVMSERPMEFVPLFLATTGVMVLVYWLMYRYIRRRLPPRS